MVSSRNEEAEIAGLMMSKEEKESKEL